jgi:hypothetical protein
VPGVVYRVSAFALITFPMAMYDSTSFVTIPSEFTLLISGIICRAHRQQDCRANQEPRSEVLLQGLIAFCIEKKTQLKSPLPEKSMDCVACKVM